MLFVPILLSSATIAISLCFLGITYQFATQQVHSLLHHASLSTANSPNPSLLQIHTLLRTLSREYQAARISCPPKPTPRRPRIAPYPGAPKVIDIRPLPKEKLTGRRHVPKLVGVHTVFPFLRFKKPQSPFLSRILRNKVKKKHLRYDRIEKMDELVVIGEWEDAWDRVVENCSFEDSLREETRKAGSLEWEDDEYEEEKEWRPRPNIGDSWTSEAKKAIMETWRANAREAKKSRQLGDKMVEIIEQEKKLAEEERRERRHLKNVEKQEKKVKESTTEHSGELTKQQKQPRVEKTEAPGVINQEKIEKKVKVKTEKLDNSAGQEKQIRIRRLGRSEEKLDKSFGQGNQLRITRVGRPEEKSDQFSGLERKLKITRSRKLGGKTTF